MGWRVAERATPGADLLSWFSPRAVKLGVVRLGVVNMGRGLSRCWPGKRRPAVLRAASGLLASRTLQAAPLSSSQPCPQTEAMFSPSYSPGKSSRQIPGTGEERCPLPRRRPMRLEEKEPFFIFFFPTKSRGRSY